MVEEERKKLEMSGGQVKKTTEKKGSKKKKDKKPKSLDFPDKVHDRKHTGALIELMYTCTWFFVNILPGKGFGLLAITNCLWYTICHDIFRVH